MSANQFGHILSWMSFGESHGPAMGVVIDGCPAGVEISLNQIEKALKRRRPGQSEIVTARTEPDQPEILSGVFEGKTLGSPIAVLVRNTNQRSEDYSEIKKNPRRGHADDLWLSKFGHADHRGGGRSSGRETLSRVVAGAVARALCERLVKINVCAVTEKIGPYSDQSLDQTFHAPLIDLDDWYDKLDHSPVRALDVEVSEKMVRLLKMARAEGQSYGGAVRLKVFGLPPGLGQPIFRKMKSELSGSFFSLGAVTAVEFGAGALASESEGIQFHSESEKDPYGGLRGGLTTGQALDFQIHFKPTSSVLDVAKNGRHDPCIVPRAIPVLEAMAWSVIADQLLWQRLDRIE